MTLNDMKIKYKTNSKILNMISEVENLQIWAQNKEIEILSKYDELEKNLQICTISSEIFIIQEKLKRLNAELKFISSTYDEQFIMIQKKLVDEIKKK